MAWNLPDQNSVTAFPRPLRVAYLVDVRNLPHEVLDEIFAESYSRWGGRRTLIVPATEAGIDEGYEKWLEFNDPDIIYSYVNLSIEVFLAIDEKYAPAHLQVHKPYGNPQNDRQYYKPRLNVEGLGCLSVLPALKARRGLFRAYDDIKIVDVDWSVNDSRFFKDNFGLLSNYNSLTSVAENLPELFTPITLITPEAFAQSRRAHSKTREYISDEKEFLNRIVSRTGTVLSLANLSDSLAQYLNFNSPEEINQTFNLVIGDTPSDRLLFWNFYQHYSNVWPHEILTMCISQSMLENPDYLEFVQKVIEIKFGRGNSQKTVILRSTSVDKGSLEEIEKKLKNKNYTYYKSEVINDLSKISPVLRSNEERFYPTSNLEIDNHIISRIEQFSGRDVRIPLAQPFHIFDQNIPPALRNGYWGIDAKIERVRDYSLYDNDRHIWIFPRRLRIDQFISRHDLNHHREWIQRTLRPNHSGLLSIFINQLSHNPILRLPEDAEAIISTLVTERYNFDPGESSNPARKKYRYARLSDKGKYLTGVLQLFESLNEAVEFFLHSFWHGIFNHLGGSPSHERENLIKTVVGKQLKTLPETDDDKRRIAEFCLKEADKIAREKHSIGWDELNDKWDEMFERWLKNNPKEADKKDHIKTDKKTLEESVQLLCQYHVLFQGQEWTCRKCYHKNWLSIDNLKSTMSCDVCSNVEPASVSKDWKFRASDFVMQALRYHGILPVIWCLKMLIKRNHNVSSFYYCSSLIMFDSDENYSKNLPDAEIDLVAVIDGEVFLCEIKSSGRIKDSDIQKFINLTNRIRPNVAILTVMEEISDKVRQELIKKVNGKFDQGIKFEIMSFKEYHLEDWPALPTGRQKWLRLF